MAMIDGKTRANAGKKTEAVLVSPLAQVVIKGRGAVSNPHVRFHQQISEPIVDDWWHPEGDGPEDYKLETTIIEDRGRTIITSNSSPDIPFTYSINPYRGCEHGCIYCYARPTHAYWDLSPGLDFETKIITKPNAPQLLHKALSHPKYECSTIHIGANTDPYQPLEVKIKTTRSILEVMQTFHQPFSIITKGTLIIRDLDILADMASRNLCSVAVSVTSLSTDLKRILEPRTASGAARLKTIKTLVDAGVPVRMMVAPVIPMINDSEVEDILRAGKEAGVTSAAMIFIRLPREVSPLFREWLAVHYPQRADHVMSLIQQSRNGKDYQSGYYQRMTGEGVFAEMIRRRFEVAARKLGINTAARTDLDTNQFKRVHQQLSLF